MESAAVPIKTLLLTVFESIAEVTLLCIAGYVLSYTGVTDKATQRKLNVINVSLFTPALLFSKVAFSLTPAKLKEMWIIPLGFVLVTGVSAAVAWFLSKAFKLKRSQTAFAICAAMFQNSNSLPIALVQSLVTVSPGLKWGDDDSTDQMLGRALTYMVLYSTLGMMLRWSWGVQLLANADDDEVVKENNGNGHVPGNHNSTHQERGHQVAITGETGQTAPVLIASPEPQHRGLNEELDPFVSAMESERSDRPATALGAGSYGHRAFSPDDYSRRSPSPSLPISHSAVSAHSMHSPVHNTTGRSRTLSRDRAPGMSRRASNHSVSRRSFTRTESGREFWGLPEQPRSRALHLAHLSEDSSESELEDDHDEWGGSELPSLRRRSPTAPRGPWKKFRDNVVASLSSAWDTFNSFMTVPMWAALLSVIIALIPALQREISRVTPFVEAIKSAGQCSIPVTLVVLGAFFYTPPQPIALQTEERPTTIKGYISAKWNKMTKPKTKPSEYPGENRTVLVACLSRMIVVPLIFLPFIALIASYDLFEAAEDPVFILCAVLLVSSPPALTLAQITQAASGDAFERLISKTISWSYAVLTPPLTLIYVVIGLFFAAM